MSVTEVPEATKGAALEDETLDSRVLTSPRPTLRRAISGTELEELTTALSIRREAIFREFAQSDGPSVVEINWKAPDLAPSPTSVLPTATKPIHGRPESITFRPFASIDATELTVRYLRAAIAFPNSRLAGQRGGPEADC
jgi:hypothetical protein